MDYSISNQQLAEILEQQRKLKSIEEQILKQIDLVNGNINYLTVEEFQLQTCEIEQKTDIDLNTKDDTPAVIESTKNVEERPPEEQPDQINKQTIDLDVNEFQTNSYEMDEDEEYF